MFFIDLKYLRLVSNKLPRFKELKNDTWNCRCVICGDSKKSDKKARGNFFRRGEKINYKCHNCGVSLSMYGFLEQVDSNLLSDYRLEYYRNRQEFEVITKPKQKDVHTKEDVDFLDVLLDRLDTLPDDNIAAKYCLDRGISRHLFKRLYYIDDVRKVHQLNGNYKESITTDEPRLFLPFYNFDGVFTGGTMRALMGEAIRYINVNIRDNEHHIFGINDVSEDEDLYVCEGPIDSLFVDNCIAVGGTSFNKVKVINNRFKKIIYIYDNQPHNKEVCKLLYRQIEDGCYVVIWPSDIKEKDINEMVENGKKVSDIIKENTYCGLMAKLKFNDWRKI